MEGNEIFDYTLQTVEGYTASTEKFLLKLFTKENDNQTNNIIDKGAEYHLSNYLLDNESTIKKIEQWEFDKNYKYSILYDISNYNEANISAIIGKEIILYEEIDGFERLYVNIMKPSLITSPSHFFFKFNIKFKIRYEEKEFKKRYPVLAIINRKDQVLELRFDSLEQVYAKNKYSYVYDTIRWLFIHIKINVTPIDLDQICVYFKDNKQSQFVKHLAQHMMLSTGGNATIDVGKDGSMVLPFIGEIKSIMDELKEEFENAPIIKKAFDDFVFDKENMSEFPWIKYKFLEHNICVKFICNNDNRGYWLIQHLYVGNSYGIGKERMEYVTRNIIETRKFIDGNSSYETGDS